jgi:uncharacterized protein YaeQ
VGFKDHVFSLADVVSSCRSPVCRSRVHPSYFVCTSALRQGRPGNMGVRDVGLAMALTATMYTFNVELSDVDRGVYETLAIRAARHPSETEEYLVTRVLAYCLEYAEGIEFSRGLAEPDEPTLAVRDLTGVVRVWIEIGAPDAERLHRATRAAPRVVVYTHKHPAQVIRQLEGSRIHRAESVELYAIDREFLAGLVAHLDRRMAFTLSVIERQLYLTIDGVQHTTEVTLHRLGGDGSE